MSSRRYTGYCLAVAMVLVGLKVVIGADVPVTSLFADDHEYLNRSPYVLRGDLRMVGYPFSGTAYGPLYPLVASPWMAVGDPVTRVRVVFAINALLSAIVTVFGSLTVFRLTRTPSLLVPVCLSAFPPVFLLSFYAMSENLLFALLAIGGWLVTDFVRTCRQPGRAALLLLVVAMLPLVRVPGLAVVPAVAWLVWLHRRELLGGRWFLMTAVLAVVVPLGAYVGVYLMSMQSTRESLYLSALDTLRSDVSLWRFPLELAASQVAYVFFTTAAWVLPSFLVAAWHLREWPDEAARQRWVDYFVYAGVSSLFFLGFAVVHLVQKLPPTAGDFIYGRYDDPAALLLLIGGLAAVMSVRRQGVLDHVLLRVVTPLALCVVLVRVTSKFWTPPANHSGLAVFAGHYWPIEYYVVAVAAVALVQLLSDRPRWYAPAAMALLLLYAVLTCRSGFEHVMNRARRGLPEVEAARWIAANLPSDARIGYDASILKARAFGGHKTMISVYRAMAFYTYPRPVKLVADERDLADVDYFYSRAHHHRTKGALVLWRRVYHQIWSSKDYAIHRVDRDAAAAALRANR